MSGGLQSSMSLAPAAATNEQLGCIRVFKVPEASKVSTNFLNFGKRFESVDDSCTQRSFVNSTQGKHLNRKTYAVPQEFERAQRL